MQMSLATKPKENKKSAGENIAASPSQTLRLDSGAENGFPLFLQRLALSDFTPTIVQRQPLEEEEETLQTQTLPGAGQSPPIEEDEEQELQTMPAGNFIQRQVEEEEEEAQPQIQAKFTVNQPNDVYEKEADRVAETVMRMPNSGIHRKPT